MASQQTQSFGKLSSLLPRTQQIAAQKPEAQKPIPKPIPKMVYWYLGQALREAALSWYARNRFAKVVR